MINIAIYDVNLLNHKNYIGEIILELSKNDTKIYAFYDEFEETSYEFLTGLGIECIKVHSVRHGFIKKLFVKNNIDLLLHNAQRLGDSAFVTIARQLGIKSIMIQHGMYVPHLKREKSLFITKIAKTIRYIRYAKIISKSISIPFPTVFKSFYSHFVKNVDYTDAIPFYQNVNSNTVFTYGEYWSEYHKKNFGYKEEQLTVIGYHELKKVIQLRDSDMLHGRFTYIAQTLVEDGRLDRASMEAFLKQLDKLAEFHQKKIAVKLHPRSDLSLYDLPNFECFTDEVPKTSVYIGHYSSLIALVNRIAPVYLYEFPGHKTPDYFLFNASVYSDMDALSKDIGKLEFLDGFETANKVFSDQYCAEHITGKILSHVEKK